MAILKVGGTQIASSSGSDVTLDNVALWSSVTGAGSWVKLQHQTISSTPTTAVIGWDPVAGETLFTSTYKVYKIICSSLKITTSSTTGVDIHMQVCHSGTTAFTGTSAAVLDNVWYGQAENTGTVLTGNSANQNFFNNFGGHEVEAGAATASSDLEITVFDPSNGDKWKKLSCYAAYTDTAATGTGVGQFQQAYGVQKNVTALTALILYPLAAASATWDDGGIIDLYGIA